MPLDDYSHQVICKLQRLASVSEDMGARPVEVVLSVRGQRAVFDFLSSTWGQRARQFQPIIFGLPYRTDERQVEPFRIVLWTPEASIFFKFESTYGVDPPGWSWTRHLRSGPLQP